MLGLYEYKHTPKESFPDVKQPYVFISTVYPGNSPKDMENLITRIIEKELNSINSVEEITSISVQDYSGINIEFNVKEDIAKAMQEVRDAIDRAKPYLPNDLPNDPIVSEFDISDFPIMYINLYGDVGEERLKKISKYLEEKIEKLREIKDVDIFGVREKIVNILADKEKLEAANITFDDIRFAIIEENITVSAGDILTDNFKRNIRIVGEFDKPEKIKDVVLKSNGAGELKISDVADVRFEFNEISSYSKMNGKPVVTLNIKKETGENIIAASNKIKLILKKAKEDKYIDDNIKIEITGDQSKDTYSMIKDLESNIISGIILVVGILMFFLGFRNALFVGVAIPISMLMGIFFVSISGTTLNMMVLFSLILALGMLVDNGIVVVENIYRLLDQGYSKIEAARKGVGEIALPIIASTFTTLAAFIPLLFWGGIMGEFMRYLPITLILVLGSSLLVGLVINPVLTASLMKIQKDKKPPRKTIKKEILTGLIFLVFALIFHLIEWYTLRGIFIIISINIFIFLFCINPLGRWFRKVGMPWLVKLYRQSLSFLLHKWRPYIVVATTVMILVISVFFYNSSKPKVIFFPESYATYINTFLELPIGTDIERTKEFTVDIEDRILKELKPYSKIIESVQTQIGANTSDPAAGFSTPGTTPNKARITVNFVEFKYRNGINTNKLVEVIRSALADIPGALITVAKNADGPPVGNPINLEILGEDFDILVNLAKTLKKELDDLNISGIEELKTNIEEGKPEVLVKINREAARKYDLNTSKIAFNMRTALFGQEISKYKTEDEDYEIWLRLKSKDRNDISNLMNLEIPAKENNRVPISAVADIEYTFSYGSIRRKNLDKVITIFSNVKEGYNATEINNQLKKYISTRTMPMGYTYKFTGEQEEQAETMKFLTFALAIAVLLIVLILVSQFNSIVVPFIIVASVIFSTIGVFFGLGIFKIDFVILMMMLGIISLAGIVVNNAIVLLDYTNLVKQRKKAQLSKDKLSKEETKEIVIEGGQKRLRPVILTAITTILGLIPLAIGFNIDFAGLIKNFAPNIYFGGDNVVFWAPMAWTIIFGLVFATILTLIVVPVMYYIKERTIRKVQEKATIIF